MYGESGRVLGKYRLIAEIARGGMGIVYLAMAQGPGGFHKLVVIKELKPDLVEDPAFLQMFLDEAKLAARLNHPNIVQTNEVGNDGDRYFMAMDYLDGRGLDRVRRRARTAGWGPSLPMHLRVACDLLAGLDYAHTLADFDGTPLGIVHRDISPQNVFVTFDGQVKLLDFGIAKAASSSHDTGAGVVKGKVSYMAPEQARGDKVDARADVFSTGILLWELLAGKKLRTGAATPATTEELPRLSTVKPWIPPELDEICARAMAFDPAQRYQTAGAFRDAIEAYLVASDTNISARDVGLCISDLFREDRAAINRLVEAHIARTREQPEHDDLPIIELSFERPSGAFDTPLPTDAAPRTSASLSIPPVTPTAAGEAVAPSPAPTAPIAPTAPTAPSATAAKRPDGARLVMYAGVAVIALSIGGIALALSSHGGAPAQAQAPGADEVDINIHVTPVGAAITIDDVPVTANPFHQVYASDPRLHRVSATAPGYAPKTQRVAFDSNLTLELSLTKLPTAPATR